MTLAIVFSLSLSAVYAQKPGYRHEPNERHQKNYGHGNYNRQNSHELARQKKELQKMIDRARRSDGYISRSERKRIEREWRSLNRNIARNNHDYRNRY